jgi:hypothetical protein
MSYDLEVLRDTIWQQVVTGTGLPEGDVIWYTQSGSRPGNELSRLWVGINLLHIDPLHEMPGFNVYNTPGAPAGAEITSQTIEHLELTFSIHVFSMNIPGGDGQASVTMHKLRNYLGRESVNSVFTGIHASIVERGSILHVPTVLNTKYESRANMSLRVRVASGDTETFTFIERVTGTFTTTPGPRSVDFDTGVTIGEF